jgi:hypothetical protein
VSSRYLKEIKIHQTFDKNIYCCNFIFWFYFENIMKMYLNCENVFHYLQLYGGFIAGQILTSFGRLFLNFLQTTRGFSLGVQDILVTAQVSIRCYEKLSCKLQCPTHYFVHSCFLIYTLVQLSCIYMLCWA